MTTEHDPLCPNLPDFWDGSILWPAQCECDVIAQARADERTRISASIVGNDLHGEYVIVPLEVLNAD